MFSITCISSSFLSKMTNYTSNVFFPLLLWYFQFCVTTVIFSLFNDLVLYGTKTCFLRLVTLLNENFSPQMVQFTVDTISRKGLKGRPNLTSQLLPPFWDCNLPWSLQFGSRELKDFSCVTVIRWNKVAWVQLQPKVKAGCGTLKAGCGTVPVLLSQCLCGLISASLVFVCSARSEIVVPFSIGESLTASDMETQRHIIQVSI